MVSLLSDNYFKMRLVHIATLEHEIALCLEEEELLSVIKEQDGINVTTCKMSLYFRKQVFRISDQV